MQDNLKNDLTAFFRAHADETYTVEDISDALHYHGSAAFKLIVQELAQLERDGLVQVTEHGHFQLDPSQKILSGTFHGNDKGFGFVQYDPDKIEPDAYIAPDNTMRALNGDTVNIEIVRAGDPRTGKGPEGKVVAITERHYEQVVGEFIQTDDDAGYVGQVRLTDKKLLKYKFYVTAVGLKPTPGEVVTAEITEYPNDAHPEAMVGIAKQVIGSVDDPGIDILEIVYQHNIPAEFPEEVLQAADEIPDHVLPEEAKGREDITDQDLVTIDGESSKDLDDAVTAWKLPNGNYHLGVHIADVSHYVKEGSLIDKEAYKRGTSVYLTDRVIPMLPRRLSNGICSLNEGELRLCMSCEMEIDHEGNVVKHRIHPSVMRSKARMTYTGVNQILEAHDPVTMDRYKELVPMFETMGDLHRILLKHRKNRGAIDFDDREAEIIVDDKGHAIDVKLRTRGLAERMIESFMLAANETVAEHYFRAKVPFLYRVHETPDGDRVRSFFEFLTAFGINVKGDPNHLRPKMLQGVLKQVAGKPEEAMVSVMMLRSLKQARYSDQSLGHFGLGAEFYTHFTSPIRRYPDTMVHRMIHYYADHGINQASKEKFGPILEEIGTHTSEMERRAIDAERSTNDMKMAEYMADHVGEEFDAVVSSVMKFGMFVELPNTIEGLIHISRMQDDYYEYVEKYLALVGRNTRRTYRIGQPIRVKVIHVDKEQSEIDFDLLDPEKAPVSDLLPHREHRSRGRFGNNRNNQHGNGHNGNGNNRNHRNGNHGQRTSNNNRSTDHRGHAGNNHRNGGQNRGGQNGGRH
ncbi:exoribonuclease R [Levilactobacillus namurensis DSM 19117]|uniref:Ribonuclease R n=1 Tax=Levilactobacillus namurensis DSM 19117 TaxID=1423773 RepID=A0A0R1JY05_9LACO|nr:ribonuclease R [Levilactobacillus namurensis]KRK76126.1 exoribonuclease R [Levilactobacillus namurensis DSM 19117]GEO75022.1 ribonuclease R [Levilactobacillus namurensis]HJE44219.1 ribonuclease R [Levilactobacillus namurensis]